MEFHPEFNLEHYLLILRRRKKTILGFAAMVVLVASFYLYLQDHYFKATATVLIDTEAASVLEVKDVVSLGEGNYWSYKEYLNTQIAIIQGRQIAENVFLELDVIEHIQSLLEIEDNDTHLRSFLKRQQRLWGQRLKQSLSLFRKEESQLHSLGVSRGFYESQLGRFMGHIDVKPIRDTRLVTVSFEARDPRFAQLVTNELVRTYVQQNLDKRTQGASEARKWLQNEYQKLKKKLDQAESTLQTFRQENDFFSEDERREIININLASLGAKLNETESLLAEYKKRYRDKHPTMQQTLHLVGSLKEKIRRVRTEAIAFEEKMIQYTALVRDVKFTQQLLENVLAREKETLISSSLSTNNIFMVEEAVAPRYPSRPKKKRMALGALLFGLFGGILLAFILEALENTVQGPDDFNRHGISFLGFVPTIRQSFFKPDHFADAYLLLNKKGIISELFNSLRTSVLLSSKRENEWKSKSLLITSFMPGEGKTLIACNLAVALAKFRYKVLLVEADIRKPRIAKVFQMTRDVGLANYLQGQNTLEEVVQPSKLKNLDVMVSGTCPEDPSELLGGDRMQALKKILEKDYDMVIYDSPPVFAVTDPVLLSQVIGSVIVVSKKNSTPRRLIPVLSEKLNKAKADIVGAIINHVREKGPNYDYQVYGEYYQHAKDHEK